MEEVIKGKEILQWHPAFYAGMQIELEEDRDNLIFENEHQLGTKPMEIDILIIKKENALPVRKNIGRIFRKYNIIEYKSPTDYLSVDDFYKVYGYVCFYKADAVKVEGIPSDELTMTLVSTGYPRRLMDHLKTERGYRIETVGEGIFYIKGDYFPIQVIITSQLSGKENMWLKSLTNKLDGTSDARTLIREYGMHKENRLYQSVMEIIVRANTEQFQEVRGMCNALLELMKDEIDAAMRDGQQRGIQQGMQQEIKDLIREFLEELGEVPEQLREQITEEKNMDTLKAYHKKASRATSIEQFCREIQ